MKKTKSMGLGGAAAFKREIARQIPDGKIVGEDLHPLMCMDFSPFISKIKASEADVVLTTT